MTEKKKKCFLITPIGNEDSGTRKRIDGVIDAAIDPTCKKYKLDMYVSHRMFLSGTTTTQIIEHILQDEIVIANLTTLNANVMYELAVRHYRGLPAILIAEHGTKLPFNISTERTIFYSNDILGGNKLKFNLEEAIKIALNPNQYKPDNPVYRVVQNLRLKPQPIKKEVLRDHKR
jgi:hypothetical protein